VVVVVINTTLHEDVSVARAALRDAEDFLKIARRNVARDAVEQALVQVLDAIDTAEVALQEILHRGGKVVA